MGGLLIRLPIDGERFFPGIEASAFFGFSKGDTFTPSFMVQYVDGYGRRLIDYRDAQTGWRVGFALIR